MGGLKDLLYFHFSPPRADCFTMTSIAEANAKFACDIFHLLSKAHPCENIVFSPVNLSAALNLLCYASQQDTTDKIEKVGVTFHSLAFFQGPYSSVPSV